MSQVSYRELGPLDAGGSSRALLGLQVTPDGEERPVVLVPAPPEVVQDEEALARLRQETARACALEHPHILRVHGLVALGDGWVRVTALAEGESLRRVLERAGRVPPLLAGRLVADAALGVHFAHVAGNDDGSPLVHGDLRPETLLLSYSGAVMVTGYGALAVAPREANGRRVPNRRAYCAPEQVVGGRSAVQPATDVFLLGLLLHECLSGRRPFASAEDLDQAVLTSSLSLLPADVPEPLGRVVERCTAKRAKDRYASALALREALLAAGGGSLPAHAALARWLQRLFPEDEPARVALRERLAAVRPRADVAPAPTPSLAAGTGAETEAPAVVAAQEPTTVPPSAAPAAPVVSAVGSTSESPRTVLPVEAPGAECAAASAQPVESAPQASRRVRPPEAPSAGHAAPSDSDEDSDSAWDAPRRGLPLAKYAREEPRRVVLPLLALLGLAAAAGIAVTRSAPASRSAPRPPAALPVPPAPAAEAQREVTLVPAPAPAAVGGPALPRQQAMEPGPAQPAAVPARGYVSVFAPAGARVSIDGRDLGTAPLQDVRVSEGRHRLVVTVGSSRWEETFRVARDERVRFDVELEEAE